MAEVSPTPNLPTTLSVTPQIDAVKIATPDLMLPLDNSGVAIETMTDMVFQDIGGHEIISVARNDLVTGRNSQYQLLANTKDLYIEYNPETILPIADSSTSQFNNFPITFETHVPEVGNGTNGEYIYFDGSGNLVIDVTNLVSGEVVEVEFVQPEDLFDDTIYLVG